MPRNRASLKESLAGRSEALRERAKRRYEELENQKKAGFAITVWNRYKEIDGADRSGVLALYVLLALFPLMMLARTRLGVSISSRWIQDLAAGQLGLDPGALERYGVAAADHSGSGIVEMTILIGGFALFGISASAVMQKAYARAWRTPQLNVLQRHLRGLAWFGAYFVLAVVEAKSRPGAPVGTRAIAATIALVATFGFWMLTPRLLLARRLTWRATLPTAIAGTVTSVGLRIASNYFVPSWIKYYVEPLGIFGMVVAVASWILITASAWILLAVFGAIWWEQVANPDDVVNFEIHGFDTEVEQDS
ncbi:MAG: hypothetical protein DCC49_10095 [Acidobacteria bacterium]|nr:MAG: hypothetical protein DCC49_10095 [Acidobacteriota bacterium]